MSYKSVNLVKAHAISIVVFRIGEIDALLHEPVYIRDREVLRDVKGEISVLGLFDDVGDFIDQIGHFLKKEHTAKRSEIVMLVIGARRLFDSSQSDNPQHTLTV